MLAAIALGSNLSSRFGSPADNMREAIHRLDDLGTVTAISRFHETEPVGYEQQPKFLNAAVLLETDISPLDLLRGLLAIEHSMGRDRASVCVPNATVGKKTACVVWSMAMVLAPGRVLRSCTISNRSCKRCTSSPMPPVDSLMPKRPVNGPNLFANCNEKRKASVVVVVIVR